MAKREAEGGVEPAGEAQESPEDKINHRGQWRWMEPQGDGTQL